MSHSPTTLILIRHADVHNPDDVLYGRLPGFRLSTIGRQEAAQTGEALRATPLAAVYSSPQLRARQTAQAVVAPHAGVRVQITSLLNEIRTGWQGTTNVEMARLKYNFYDPPRDPGDETLAQVTDRLVRWVRLMLRRHPGQVVAGVSHGDPVMIARLLFTGTQPSVLALRDQSLYPTKGSITRLVFTGTGDPLGQQPVVTYEDPNAALHLVHGHGDRNLSDGAAASDAAAPWASRSEEFEESKH